MFDVDDIFVFFFFIFLFFVSFLSGFFQSLSWLKLMAMYLWQNMAFQSLLC